MKARLLFGILLWCISFISFGQPANGDYQSVRSGDWNDPSNWEIYNGVSWLPAALAPSAIDGVVSIRNSHTITTLGVNIGGQVIVEQNAVLKMENTHAYFVALLIHGTVEWINCQISFPSGVVINNYGAIILTANNQIMANGKLINNPGAVIRQKYDIDFTDFDYMEVVNNGTIEGAGILVIPYHSGNGIIAPGGESSTGFLWFHEFAIFETLNIEIINGSGYDHFRGRFDPSQVTLNVTEIGDVPDGEYEIIQDLFPIVGIFKTVNLPPNYCIVYNRFDEVLGLYFIVVRKGGASNYYLDSDGDGHGDINDPGVVSCSPPVGRVDNNDDCDDTDPLVHPGANESCNGIDDDCDGQIDEGVTTNYYRDKDGDGYGLADDIVSSCQQPLGYAFKPGDCNDNNAGISPATVWCKDEDNDGYGDGTIMIQCEQPAGFKAASCLVATLGDCNDHNANIHPGATEICGNGINDDCDDSTSDICPVGDNDNDGDPDDSDCNDNNPNIHHGAIEVCNGLDDNCNGLIDENISITATITPSGIQNLCSGKTLTLIASPSLAGNTFAWYRNNRIIDNQTSSTLEVNSAGDYKVKITQNNCTAISAATTINLIASPSASIKISGKNSNPCNGAVQLVANSVQGTYNWYKDGVLQHSTGSSLTATMAGEYWVVITKNGCSTESNHLILGCPSLKARSTETINEIANIRNRLSVRPNPATNFIEVQWTTKNTSQRIIRILNSEGRMVKTFSIKTAMNKQTISLEGLAKGVYILELRAGADIQISKFVIQ